MSNKPKHPVQIPFDKRDHKRLVEASKAVHMTPTALARKLVLEGLKDLEIGLEAER